MRKTRSKTSNEIYIKPFSELKASTNTVIVYTNLLFDNKLIFNKIHYNSCTYKLKKNRIDKKSVEAPYGSIISVQSKTLIRGLLLKKSKKIWCTICQPYSDENSIGGKPKKVFTAKEIYVQIESEKEDLYEVKYFCTRCDKIYQYSDLKKIAHFLNQTSVVLILQKDKSENIPHIHIMIFKDCFKLAGCKSEDAAHEAVRILWEDYLSNINGAYKLKDKNDCPKFAFRVSMRNYDFAIGFPIDRVQLNLLMNSEKYSDKVFLSQYETTNHTAVNVKMFSKKPKDFSYKCLSYSRHDTRDPDLIELGRRIYFRKKKKKDGKQTSCITFASSKTIFTGRYLKQMEENYNFYTKTIIENRELLEEKNHLREVEEIDIDDYIIE